MDSSEHQGAATLVAIRARFAIAAITASVALLLTPHGKKRLSTCDRDAIRSWINEGAKDN
jgi:hypothetical protein